VPFALDARIYLRSNLQVQVVSPCSGPAVPPSGLQLQLQLLLRLAGAKAALPAHGLCLGVLLMTNTGFLLKFHNFNIGNICFFLHMLPYG